MARIKIMVKAVSPLSIGTTKAYGGTLVETGLYLAGARLRGALAAFKTRVSEGEKAELDRLLGTDNEAGINFPNCYLISDPNTISFPLPITAETCKRSPGLNSNPAGLSDGHGIADTLLRQLAYDQIIGANGHATTLPFIYRCTECGHRTDSGNIGVLEYRGRGSYDKPVLQSHRQTRVAINRARRTAEEGMLYSVRAINEESLFAGVADLDDERLELARKWLPHVERIGGRTSRGFGKVEVSLADPPAETPLPERVRDLNDKYRQYQEELAVLVDDARIDDRLLFTINLRSDALLRDSIGAPTIRFDDQLLLDALDQLLHAGDREELRAMRIEFVAQFASPQHISGWQTAWRLPKEVLLAVQMGSLYVFAAHPSDQQQQEKLINWLSRVEAAGIGEMREDGFGQIAICDPFHLEVDQYE